MPPSRDGHELKMSGFQESQCTNPMECEGRDDADPPAPTLPRSSPGSAHRSAGPGPHRHLGLPWHLRPGIFNRQSVRHSQPRLL